jgi:pimeloyl-ACP methyl ester carboxylesterase
MIIIKAILCSSILLFMIMRTIDIIKRNQIVKKYEDLSNSSDRFIDIDGIKLYYIEQGEGFPVVIIHGFMCSCEDFRNIIKALSAYYKVIAVDLIGFGKSDKREDLNYSKKNMADLIYKLMSNKGYKKYSVIGHSMGGGVALNLVHHHAESIKSLVLVDSVGYKNIRRPPIPPVLIEIVFKQYYLQKLFYRICIYNTSNFNAERFDKIYYLNCAIPSKTIYNFSRQDDSKTAEGNMRNITLPTLILWGKYDRITPIQNAYYFNNDINGSKLIIFDKSGHMPYVEEEEKFVEVVLRFFSSTILQY